jgi:hypothetical protein
LFLALGDDWVLEAGEYVEEERNKKGARISAVAKTI